MRISAPMSFGQLYLVPAINEFLTVLPGLDLDLNLNDRHVSIVDEAYDLVVRIGDLVPILAGYRNQTLALASR